MAKISREVVLAVVAGVGGTGNIARCGNCMTRLRMTLHNNQLADKTAIRQVAGVMGVIDSDEQFQVVLGPGNAQKASDWINEMLESGEQVAPMQANASDQPLSAEQLAAANKKQLKAKQTSGVHKFLSRFATIFTPLIPGFIAVGLLLGLATLMEQMFIQGVDHPSAVLVEIVGYMKVFSKGMFAFLSILIGYNAQQAFGGSGVNGAIIASLFVMGYDPHATSGFYAGMEAFFGHTIDPRGNIIGVLIAAIVGAFVERQVRRFISPNLDMILTSAITLLIMGAITFVVIMPLGVVLFNGMSWLFMHLNGNPFGTAVLAGVFLIAVMFGVHQGFVPVYFALMEAQGFNSLFPILAMAGGGQVGAAVALYFRAAKGATLRNQIKGTLIPGILGIGEPLIYGVTLPRVKPFVTACLGGAAGGFFIGLVAWLGLPVGLNSVFGPSGIVALPLMTSSEGIFPGMAVYAIGLTITWVAGFIFTWFFGYKNVDLN